MKIGELAEAAQCTVETIRYYEKAGLLPKTDRTGNNYRLYSQRHLDRLRFIRNCRSLDMSQEEVQSLLALMEKPEKDCDSVNHLIDEHISHVEIRIKELQGLKEQLTSLRKQCESKRRVKECGIVKGISSMRVKGKAVASSHLG
ncbi:transcriptional regulator, MerR family [Verrucomicrobium sp. GAS474]|uniref:Cd(II)/Pb(II)-responsive transcriptional regulator n=1 Tax=Verrucomicrobium sp. GAS474 TaxID=1882831 RepID=UPI00087D7911|nr:Cd(II)/Pb(II)-responsive transcriptional regulator [Verrucomicrobium sp. GAS474]SDT90971.1 transcriptional regulator, MerR family [Verrucomicrobium sp. GAS474]